MDHIFINHIKDHFVIVIFLKSIAFFWTINNHGQKWNNMSSYFWHLKFFPFLLPREKWNILFSKCFVKEFLTCFNRLFIDQWNLYLIVSGIIIFNQIISLILPRLIIDPSPYYALQSVQDLEFQVGHYKKHKACSCPINQYLSQSILKSTKCLSVLPFFNPLPMNQFDSQVYLWISFNKAEILRPF